MKKKFSVTIWIAVLTVLIVSIGMLNAEEKVKKQGYIGVMIEDVTKEIAKRERYKGTEGAYVTDVVEDGPADSAGVRKGDIIIEFAGTKIGNGKELTKAVRKAVPDSKVAIVVMRGGEKKTLQITVGKSKSIERSYRVTVPSMPHVQVFVGRGIMGLELRTLNEQLGEYFGAPNNEGVLVESVEKESPADKAGFKAGDVIIRVGKKNIDEVRDIDKAFSKFEEGDTVEVEVVRKGARKVLSIEVEEREHFEPFRFFRKFRPEIQKFYTPEGDVDVRIEKRIETDEGDES